MHNQKHLEACFITQKGGHLKGKAKGGIQGYTPLTRPTLPFLSSAKQAKMDLHATTFGIILLPYRVTLYADVLSASSKKICIRGL